MPYKDPVKQKAFMKAFMTTRKIENKAFVVSFRNRTYCSGCGKREDFEDYKFLEFHHNNPLTKKTKINKMSMFTRAAIKKEMQKCTLLCYDCHIFTHEHFVRG